MCMLRGHVTINWTIARETKSDGSERLSDLHSTLAQTWAALWAALKEAAVNVSLAGCSGLKLVGARDDGHASG